MQSLSVSEQVEFFIEENIKMEILDENETILESSPLTKIYIVLSDTKTTFSKLASFITNRRYNHISISFEKTLSTLYSFDLKFNTIVEEFLNLFEQTTDFLVYSIEVTQEIKNRIEEKVLKMVNNAKLFSYSKLSLLKIAINKVLKTNYFTQDSDSENEFICSTFISHLFESANIQIFKKGKIAAPSDYKQNKILRFEYKTKVKELASS